jgi:hypothetical protein
MIFGSWYNDDDYTFISRLFERGPTGHALLAGYSGHFMPAGFGLTWLLQHTWPFQFWAPATCILLLQLVADAGVLRLLTTLFGARLAILPLLCVALFTVFTVPAALWWAIAINQLPYLAAMAWATSAFVDYLRDRRTLSAVKVACWLLFGMLFYEKAILIPVLLAFLFLGYFSSGPVRHRLRDLRRNYWQGALMIVGLAFAYVVAYLTWARSFGAGQTIGDSFFPTMENLVFRCWAVGIYGGPLRWSHIPGSPLSFASPLGPVVLLAALATVLLVHEVGRTRLNGRRAFLLPATFLLLDGLVLTGGRASLGGAFFGLDYRYVAEMALVTAIGLGCATLPIPGAQVVVQPRAASSFLDSRRAVGAVTAVVTGFALVSSIHFASTWHRDHAGAVYMRAFLSDVEQLSQPTPLADQTLPGYVMWPLTFPANTTQRVLRPTPPNVRFVQTATDRILLAGPDGHLRPMMVSPVRRALDPGSGGCPHRTGARMRTIRLDGPVNVAGWWVRIGYIASADSSIDVAAGGTTRRTSIRAGLHNLYFQSGDKPFSTVQLGHLVGAAVLCTSDVSVGPPATGVVP